MTTKTTILFLIPNLNPGGAERVLTTIIRTLDKKKFNIHLAMVSKIGIYCSLIPEYVNCYDLKCKKTSLSFFKVNKIIRKVSPKIIFSTTHRMNIVTSLSSLFIFKKIKLFLRIPNSPYQELKQKKISRFTHMLLMLSYRIADKCIAQTPEMKNEISKYYKVNLNKIHVFINPIDAELIKDSIIDQLNPFEQDVINIVASGRLSYQKGYDFLLKCFKKIHDNNNNFRLHILGKDDGEKSNLLKMVNDLKLDNIVKFWGAQKNPYKFYFFSDLFVLTSRWEGLPNVVLENLFLKKPVVVTNSAKYLETIIDDGKNGFILNFGDSEKLIKSIQKYKDLKPTNGIFATKDANSLFLNVKV